MGQKTSTENILSFISFLFYYWPGTNKLLNKFHWLVTMSSQLLPATVADQATKTENAAYKVQSNIWLRPPLL